MAASYPTSAKGFQAKQAGGAILSSHVNELQEEVTAIETQLIAGGVNIATATPTANAVPKADASGKLADGWNLVGKDGWIPVSDSWTYASASTITVPSGAAAIYSVGDKLRLTNSTVKYFYIVGVADTVLTITGGSEYTLVSVAISAVSYSHAASPVGFPQWFNYTPVFSGATVTGGSISTSRFTVIGKTCIWRYSDYSRSITTAGSVSLSLPVTGADDGIIQVYSTAANFAQCSISGSGTTIRFWKTQTYGTEFAGNETGWAFAGTYIITIP